MKKVMVFGTFDIFHRGHIDFLKQAGKYGDFLIVVVARDKTVRKVKGKMPLHNEKERVAEVARSGLAQKVLSGNLKDRYAVIRKYRPRIICLGYDQKFFIDELRSKLDKAGLADTKIVRLKSYHPEKYKSSRLKQKLMGIGDIVREINKYKNKERAVISSGFFKTGKGQYGEGDKFLGLTVPMQRKIAKQFADFELKDVALLLGSKYHDYRMIGLFILIYKYEKAIGAERKKIYKFYLKNLRAVNNWDLVDLSALHILGRYLWESGDGRGLIYELIKSENLWRRRIGVLATFYFIKNEDFKDILRVAEILLKDKEDLIQKAVGWMLREMGKREADELVRFLNKHFRTMPRTMLRYAIERLSVEQKIYYMKK